jgi:ferrous iron transport protein A
MIAAAPRPHGWRRLYNENNSHLPVAPALKLSLLPRRTAATVDTVDDATPNDGIARRLRELGFVAGERVEIVAVGPFSADPLLVQVGYTRFALRRSEAERIRVRTDAVEASA